MTCPQRPKLTFNLAVTWPASSHPCSPACSLPGLRDVTLLPYPWTFPKHLAVVGPRTEGALDTRIFTLSLLAEMPAGVQGRPPCTLATAVPFSTLAESRAGSPDSQAHIMSLQFQFNIGRAGKSQGGEDLLSLQVLTFWMPDCMQGQKPSLGG